MAISIISQPKLLQPAYNQVYFVADSTNSSQLAMRYLYSVYNDDTNNLIASLRIAPEPSFGYGAVDISKIIQSQVTNSLDFNATQFQAPNNYVKYRVEIQEEYTENWVFTGITGTVGIPVFTLNGVASSPWTTADQIRIDNVTGNTNFEGLYTVLSSVGNNLTVLGYYSTGATSGSVYWANQTKTTSTATTIDDLYAFNGVRSFKDFYSYNEVNYLIPQSTSGTSKLFLTDMPSSGFTVTETQDLWLSMFRNPSTTGQTIQYRIVNSNGDVFKNGVNFSTDTSLESSVALGPGNFNPILVSGSLPVIKSNTTYYDIYLATTGGTQLSQSYRINIDTRCKIEEYEILFQDRMGSWLSYAFQLRAKETGTIERSTFNKNLGNIDAVNGWEYQLKDAGQTIYNVNLQKELELNTNWMNDEMSVLFEQLLTSPVTYLKDTDGLYYACIVQDNGFETTRQKNKNLIKKSVKVAYASNNNINI